MESAGGPGEHPHGRVVLLAPAAAPGPVPEPTALSTRQRLTGAGLDGRTARAQQILLAAVGAHIIAVIAGLVGADYVESAYFSLIVPGLAGFACAAWVIRAAPSWTGPRGTALAAAYAVCSAAFAFVYADTPYGAAGTWLPPLLCAVAGAVVWPFVDPTPPAKRQQPAGGQPRGTGTTARMPEPPGDEQAGPTT